MRLPIHREGWRFVGLFALATALLFLVAQPLGWVGVVLSLWCVWFFRDPERTTPDGAGLVVSPADGKILPIVQAHAPAELGMADIPRTRISIFMDIFNVHVNRAPCDGVVKALSYRPGAFFNASFDKASEQNERMAAWIVCSPPGEKSMDIAVVQIAGLVARRIKTDLKEEQQVRRGERYGIIRFGSRLDVYLPDGVRPLVTQGQKVIAGETILAKLGVPDGINQG